MAKTLTKQERWERYLESAEMLFAFVEGLKITGKINNPRIVNKLCGLIAEELYRVPATNIGLISENAAKSKKKTPDHYHGRKASGDLICKMILRGCSIQRIALLIWSRSRVIYVTSAENTRLKKFDGKNPYKTFKEAMSEYSAANVSKLIPYSQKTIYLIDGIEYTAIEACTTYKISAQTLKNRCTKDKRGKYPTWQVKENQ